MNVHIIVTKEKEPRLFICKTNNEPEALRLTNFIRDDVFIWQVYCGDLNIINQNPTFMIELLPSVSL